MLNDEILTNEIERALWAKSEPFKPLCMHLLETGIIAQELITAGCFYPVGDELAGNFGIARNEIVNLVGYIGSVHDLGKCYGHFQKQAPDSEIAEILDITVNRVYYLLRRNKTKLNTNTKKYDYDEIESLSKSGMKPKEISEKLDIPLRSVYYILNKK